jgi:hypothetical protein
MDDASIEAKKLRMQIGFHVPDASNSLIEAKEYLEEAGINEFRAYDCRIIPIQIDFIQVVDMISGEKVAQFFRRGYTGIRTFPHFNRDSRPLFDPSPQLTDALKGRSFNAKITVNVEIDADGSHTEEFVTPSGDPDVDALILKAMRGWKWRPAIVIRVWTNFAMPRAF